MLMSLANFPIIAQTGSQPRHRHQQTEAGGAAQLAISGHPTPGGSIKHRRRRQQT